MKDLTIEQCNKVLAIFSNEPFKNGKVIAYNELGNEIAIPQFTESLDRVSVIWNTLKEKYEDFDLRQHYGRAKGFKYYLCFRNPNYEYSEDLDIPMSFKGECYNQDIRIAAAMATAKIILSINEEIKKSTI